MKKEAEKLTGKDVIILNERRFPVRNTNRLMDHVNVEVFEEGHIERKVFPVGELVEVA